MSDKPYCAITTTANDYVPLILAGIGLTIAIDGYTKGSTTLKAQALDPVSYNFLYTIGIFSGIIYMSNFVTDKLKKLSC